MRQVRLNRGGCPACISRIQVKAGIMSGELISQVEHAACSEQQEQQDQITSCLRPGGCVLQLAAKPD